MGRSRTALSRPSSAQLGASRRTPFAAAAVAARLPLGPNELLFGLNGLPFGLNGFQLVAKIAH